MTRIHANPKSLTWAHERACLPGRQAGRARQTRTPKSPRTGNRTEIITMAAYSPPFQLTHRMTAAISNIAELLGAWKAVSAEALRPELRRGNRIRSIQASLAVEQNTLTLEQVTAVLEGRHVLGSPREIQEVRNAFAAYESMGQWQPDRVEDLLAAHGVMMTALVDDAGHWRRGGVGVMAGDKVIHMAPPASQVPRLMQDLLHWLANTEAHPPRRHSTTSSSSSIPSATETGAWGGCGRR